MKIEISVRDSDARIWEYFLRKRYKKKASLKTLCRVAILREIASEAKRDIGK